MKIKNTVIALILAFVCIVSGCSVIDTPSSAVTDNPQQTAETIIQEETPIESEAEPDAIAEEENEPKTEINSSLPTETTSFDINSIPDYSGIAYIPINGNIPFFTQADYTTTSFETYSPLDSLGRCGVAYACLGSNLMPTEERGNIGSVKPSGWQTIRYECVDGLYLYNRCHLIGFQLSGENANTRNLITGTRSMNVDAMLDFENMVADYIKETDNHVLYRVTPIFEGSNLLATGVLMEGYSVEDDGDEICFNVFCYNEQPGIIINHADGSNRAEDGSAPYGSSTTNTKSQESQSDGSTTNQRVSSYIGNKNSKKLHYPDCGSVKQMKDTNKVYLNCTRDQALAQGYDPCKNCNP